MFDELLGRAELKERIETLESEKADLEAQLAAEQQRRADAVTDRQEAQRRVNELEDRVTELRDRVDRLQGEDRGLSFRSRETVRGGRLSAVLDRLASVETDPEGVVTAFVDDGDGLPDAIRSAFGERAALIERAAPCLAVADDTGMLSVALDVPVTPDPFASWDDHVAFDRSWFEPTGEFTLALVRSDLFAMGVYDGRDRTAFHGFDSTLERNHSKGGFSQARFERRRDEQIDSHLDRVAAALDERPQDAPLYLVGETTVLYDVVADVDARATVDATGDPEPALDDAFQSLFSVTLYAV